MESEVLPLFLGGVSLVLLFELFFSLLILRRYRVVRRAMIAHVVCILVAFVCLGLIFFGPNTLPDGGSYDQSGRFALFGIAWFVGECCVIGAMTALLGKKGKEPAEKKESSVKITKL